MQYELSKPEVEVLGAALDWYKKFASYRLGQMILYRWNEKQYWWEAQLKIVEGLLEKLTY